MTTSTENIRKWIEQSDIDYYTYFIKAWIPFNAWYNSRYSNLDSDRAKINAIKREQSDPIRKAINAYLENGDENEESRIFRNYVGELHYTLEQAQLDSSEGRISFTQIVKEKNSINCINNEEIRGVKYYLKRDDGNRLGEINKILVCVKNRNGTTVINYEHTEYDLENFKLHPKFISLSDNQKDNVTASFKKLNPIVVTDIIETNHTEPKNYYNCSQFKFKRDMQETNCYGHIVAKAIIESLYQLRNILFHGELTPNEAASQVYKNAYFLLKMLLDKIK